MATASLSSINLWAYLNFKQMILQQIRGPHTSDFFPLKLELMVQNTSLLEAPPQPKSRLTTY
jgi:hypothetical protein